MVKLDAGSFVEVVSRMTCVNRIKSIPIFIINKIVLVEHNIGTY